MKAKTEKEIEIEILDWLNRHGYFAFKIDNGAVYDEEKRVFRKKNKFAIKGISDIICAGPNGQIIALEVKSDTGRATKEQIAFISKIKKCGGVAAIVRSVEETKVVLSEHGLDWQAIAKQEK